MRGEGRAWAAISILNGTSTGTGCSLAVEGGVEATWTWSETGAFSSEPPCDDAVARAVFAQLPAEGRSAIIQTRSTFPASRGLKTSSAAAAALLRAAHASLGVKLGDAETVARSVFACRAAGVTLTGALDDQAAVVAGGCHLADSESGRILDSFAVPRWHVAIWVPEQAIAKSAVRRLDASPAVAASRALASTLRSERIPEALTANGRLFTALYRSAGLPVTQEPAEVALAAGALGAGLSGTGPAVAALFEEPVELPVVAGGDWHWTRAVPEAP